MSLTHRRDNRTVEKFKSDISAHTKKEKVAAESLRIDLEIRNNSPVEIIDYGVDNSGSLITGNVHARPDYIFKLQQSELPIEIKVHSEKWDFITFKNSNLNTYKKHNGQIAVIRENYYMLFKTGAIDFIIDNVKAKIYPGFSPNDVAHRLYCDDIESLISVNLLIKYEWLEKAKDYLDKGKIFR